MIYLLHFEPRYRHAGHYTGFTQRADLFDRLDEHAAGGSASSPLVRAAIAAGCVVYLARVYPTGDRSFERRLKNRGGAARHCPICKEVV